MNPPAEESEHIDHSHTDVSGGWVRAAVFGAMDGLVSNISLIAGVGGGGVSRETIVLTGAAGLVAGAISMGIGEYTSVRTQNEQVDAEIEKERLELERHPHAEQRELAAMLRHRGLSGDLADRIAVEVSRDAELALRIHAQEELGVTPDERPSPWTAAITSFVCFAVGAFVPLLPYLLGSDALWLALAVGGVGLFGAGSLVSRLTTRSWWGNGLRQLVLGGLAAGATYLIGRLIGVTIGG
ncbi:MAG TPA: VIT1/CCC1 transporter family protein [Cryptosporangiaceae bacterium]|nr:VIT1/CCC1 transporter family protein [Cryptosporangiaceae bacterium]